jgi:hypothetical protein
MKISRKDLEKLISEVMAEERIPGEATARSEQAYRRNSPAGTRQRAGKGLNTARRRRDKWAVRDVDGDGDFDLENVGGKMSPPIHGKGLTASGVKAETGDIIIGAGIIDPEGWAALSSDEHFEDPKFGRKTREGTLNKFMMDLAYDIARGDEQRLELDQIRKLADLNPEWSQALDQFDADVADEMRRQEDYEDMYGLNESKETRMSKGFGRNDIKAWFAQTLYEDFETSKPRKRRSTGVLTEAAGDESTPEIDGDVLVAITNCLVLGIESNFGVNLPEGQETELNMKFKGVLEEYPGLIKELEPTFKHYLQQLNDKLKSKSQADGADFIDAIAREVADIMDSDDLVTMPKSQLDRIIDDMIADDDLSPAAASANIDMDDLYVMVREIQGGIDDYINKNSYYKEEITRQVASDLFDNMRADQVTEDIFKSVIDDFIAAGRFGQEQYESSGVKLKDIQDKIREYEREYGDDPPPRY